MEKQVIKFEKERDTKRTVRYQEVVPEGEAPKIGVLYVQKHIQPPDELTVTLE